MTKTKSNVLDRYKNLFNGINIREISKEQIISILTSFYENKKSINKKFILNNYQKLYCAAVDLFGSWDEALKASNINPINICKKNTNKWTKDSLTRALKEIPVSNLSPIVLKTKYNGIYTACIRVFGSLKNAIENIGINYEDILINVPWTREKIINIINFYYKNNEPINFKYVSKHHNRLKKIAEIIFGSWGNAVEAAGINYDSIKPLTGWGKQYLSKDGNMYYSQTEGLVADKLFEFKNEQIILDYKSQVVVTPSKNWTCDFRIIFTTGFELLLEVDSLGDNRIHGGSYTDSHPKIKFYKKYRYPYEIVSSFSELDIIIDKYSKYYFIPLKDSIITSHINPDGDAISSCVALYNYLKINDKKVSIKLCGTIPTNLSWILNDIKNDDDLNSCEQVIVLDSNCTKERIGWEISSNLSIINIDHHGTNRINEHNPDKGIYIINACSTAVVLFRWFGIKDNVLAIGAYTDTYFSKNITEVLCFLADLNISDEEIEDILEKVSFRSDRKTWHIIRDSKVNNYKNGFVVETNESDITSIENAMTILMKMNNTVYLIYGKEKNVKLRTNDKSLNVSEIAKLFGGGGHRFAALCNVKNKVSEFKDYIKHYKKVSNKINK
ncbi:MAG: DHH family phosphoesterase [Patescibacteria group bacterium]|jgi:phosphoesterase RecJ-like protein